MIGREHFMDKVSRESKPNTFKVSKEYNEIRWRFRSLNAIP